MPQQDPEAWAPIDLARTPEFAIGSIRVTPPSCEMALATGVRRLEPRVMQVLIALWEGCGRVVSRDELIQRCWGGVIVGDNAIQQAVAAVRRLAALETPPAFGIETIPKIGY